MPVRKVGVVPKGYHRMPDGSLMKGSGHKESAKHERTESKAEKRAEYGPARKPKPKKKSPPKRTSAAVRKNNMDQ